MMKQKTEFGMGNGEFGKEKQRPAI